MLRGLLSRHILRAPTPRSRLHARLASSGRVAPATASQARGRISRRPPSRWVPSLERTFSSPHAQPAAFPACGRPTTPRAASSEDTDMAALPKGEGAEALAAQSCADLGACSRCAARLTTPRPPRATHESRPFHSFTKHFFFSSDVARPVPVPTVERVPFVLPRDPNAQRYPSPDPGADRDARARRAFVARVGGFDDARAFLHGEKLGVRVFVSQRLVARRRGGGTSPRRAPDKLPGRADRPHHARHRGLVHARLRARRKARRARRHVLAKVVARKRARYVGSCVFLFSFFLFFKAP